jgi:hypothetical protein
VCVLAIGLLPPKAAIVEHDLAGGNVIPKTEAAQGQPILTALSRPDTLELLDVVLAAEIEGIAFQDSKGYSV